MDFGQLIAIIIGAVFVNNYVLGRFLGLCPFVGVSNPANIIKQVVLPDPDGPSIVKNSPLGKARFKSFTTRFSPS